jgi:NAD(P)-dependent dehydrogenase (short-subunit alcohol dehydrogenase family)
MSSTLASTRSSELAGKRALVTGGTRGIGAAIVARLAAAGATVVTSARSAADGLPEGVRLVVADASTSDGTEHLAAEALRVLGGVDILVNNAGGAAAWFPEGALSIPDDHWFQALATNLLSAVRLDRLLIPQMRERGFGAVVQISSSNARQPASPLAHYAAAKAALTNYSKSLSLQVAGDRAGVLSG